MSNKISSYSTFICDRVNYGIEYAARRSKELGFDSVEYLVRFETDITQNATEEREILDRYGLSVSCYSVLSNLYTAAIAQKESSSAV